MTTTISATLIARVCGLPVTAVEDLCAPEATTSIRIAVAAEQHATELGARLSDDLYGLVPTLDDAPGVRRQVLRLRRDIHNVRCTDATRGAATETIPRLGVAATRRLQQWVQDVELRDDHLRKAREVVAGELAAASQRVRRRLLTPVVSRGLAFASPGFTRELAKRGPSSAHLTSREARSAVAYMTRTALKPSPFATLATVGVTRFGPAPARGMSAGAGPSHHDATRVVTTSRTAALALWRLWAEDESSSCHVGLVANPSLRDTGGALRAALPLYVQAHSVLFRHDELTDCEMVRWAVDRLPSEPATAREIAERLDVDLDSVLRLVTSGVLVPVTPWSIDRLDEFTAATHWLDDRPDAAGPVPDAIRALAGITPSADAGPEAVAQASDRARSLVATAFRESGRAAPYWLPHLAMLHETAAHDAEHSPCVPSSVTADLHELADLLRPHVHLNAGYRRLVDAFVARHGSGGSAPDLLSFLYGVTAGADPWTIDRALTEVEMTAPDPLLLSGHGTVGPPCHTVFFQIAAPDEAAVRSGDYRLVVNNIQPGFPGLTVRWAAVPALREALEAELVDWAHTQHPGATVYGFSAHADWVDFQRPVVGSLPRVTWAADGASPPSGGVDLAGFTLHHDPVSNTLQVRDPAGHPASFAYLGAIPPRILRGVDRLLSLLADPWVTPDLSARRMTAATAATASPDAGAGKRLPRLRSHRLILRRATWLLPAGGLPVPGRDAVSFLADVERWRVHNALPDEVFIRQVPTTWTGRPEKPQWVGFEHPHTVVAALHGAVDAGGFVEVTEALPARSETWWRDRSDNPTAAEFQAVIHHG